MPTRAELEAADGTVLQDLVGPDLRLLIVGINPGRHSGHSGFHFGNRRNHLWAALHRSGLTPRLLAPTEAADLLALGIGITNLVMRTTAGSTDIQREEYREGVTRLRETVRTHRPRLVAILTRGGYEKGFDRRLREYGPQPEPFEGRPLWVLPNPSPRNPTYDETFHAAWFTKLRSAVDAASTASG